MGKLTCWPVPSSFLDPEDTRVVSRCYPFGHPRSDAVCKARQSGDPAVELNNGYSKRPLLRNTAQPCMIPVPRNHALEASHSKHIGIVREKRGIHGRFCTLVVTLNVRPYVVVSRRILQCSQPYKARTINRREYTAMQGLRTQSADIAALDERSDAPLPVGHPCYHDLFKLDFCTRSYDSLRAISHHAIYPLKLPTSFELRTHTHLRCLQLRSRLPAIECSTSIGTLGVDL